ncbi:MAG: imidazole glycerol phosphate synthase subunit HisH [Planctomycetota bacterium]
MTGLAVHVLATGSANLASVFAGLRRAGAEPILAEDVSQVASARAVMLPGVGSFGAAMDRLGSLGLVAALRQRIDAGRPTFAICLGLQILFEASEESPGVRGLGVIPGRIGRFEVKLRVPQLGWNSVRADDGCELLTDGEAYFANSFRCTEQPAGWNAAVTDHGGPFISGIERGPVLACQFHPELSDQWGLGLMRRWVQRASVEVAAC